MNVLKILVILALINHLTKIIVYNQVEGSVCTKVKKLFMYVHHLYCVLFEVTAPDLVIFNLN